MTSEALTALKQMISDGGIDFSADVPTLREKFNGMLESLPVDDEAVITPPEASPIYGDLQGLPPLSVHVGSAEILLDDAVRLARAAGLDQVAAQLKIWPEMVHDWGLFSFMLPEGEQLIQEVAAFIGSYLKAAVAAR